MDISARFNSNGTPKEVAKDLETLLKSLLPHLKIEDLHEHRIEIDVRCYTVPTDAFWRRAEAGATATATTDATATTEEEEIGDGSEAKITKDELVRTLNKLSNALGSAKAVKDLLAEYTPNGKLGELAEADYVHVSVRANAMLLEEAS